MAEFKRNKSKDYLWTQGGSEPIVDIVKSIREMRGIYKDMEDEVFCMWYANRYKVRAEDVRRVIKKQA